MPNAGDTEGIEMKPNVYPKATILLMEEGEYSDRGSCGELVTLCELDLRAEIEAWRLSLGKDEDSGCWVADDWDHGPSAFVAHLVATQKCAPLKCQTVHIGSYGRVEL